MDSLVRGSKLTDATITPNYKVVDKDLREVELTRCSAIGFTAINTDLTEAKFRSVNMLGGMLDGVFDLAIITINVSGGFVVARSAEGTSFYDGSWRGSTVSGDLSHSLFAGVDLRGADFSGVTSFNGTEFDRHCDTARMILGDARLAEAIINFNSHVLTGTLLYQEALLGNNIERQAYSLLIRDREDLCDELWKPDSKLYPEGFRNWAFSIIERQMKEVGGVISTEFEDEISATLGRG